MSPSPAPGSGSRIPLETDCATVKARLNAKDDFLLLDCRERDEHQFVNIKQALLLPMSELTDRVGELDSYRQKSIVVHCHHGGRSLKVANWLRSQGFANVQSLAGGIDTWSVEIDHSLPRY